MELHSTAEWKPIRHGRRRGEGGRRGKGEVAQINRGHELSVPSQPQLKAFFVPAFILMLSTVAGCSLAIFG